MEVDWDKHLREETNAYLDKQDIIEDFNGEPQRLSNPKLMRYEDEYYLAQDAWDFLEYLDLSAQEILIRMGAE